MINKIFLILFQYSFYKISSFVNNKFVVNRKMLSTTNQFDISNNINNINNINTNNEFYRFNILPRLDEPNETGILTWYPIGFSNDFTLKPKRITIRDINYIVWKDNYNNYYGLRDCCSHQGSSFQFGEVNKNTISCPYHGYIFDGTNGELIEIPELHQTPKSNSHNINCYKVVEKGNIIYFNTIPIKNEEIKNKIDESLIFIEPEYFDHNQRVVNIKEDFEHYAKFISVNSLDICHIGFVHTFGNKKNPNPIYNSKIIKLNDTDFHYKIIYEYISGKNSLVNKIYNFNKITVENEYILPHTTVARIIFGNFTSTIITHALPVSKFKTKLFVKAYRSYLVYDYKKNNPLFYPFYKIINNFGDIITKNTMITTIKQDKSIVDFIDKTDYKSMHGSFSIIYDKFSNHYKNNYKKYYENGHENI